MAVRKIIGGDPQGLAAAYAMPWKPFNEVRRIALVPLAAAYFSLHGVRWGGGWRVHGLPLIQRHRISSIAIGDDFELRSWFSSNPLGARRSILTTWAAGARIELGEGVKATGLTICAQIEVCIGDRVRIGANSTIIDTDFHPVGSDNRRIDPRAGRGSPIEVGHDVFIGMGTYILKGVHVGEGAVIGAGSVVTANVPAGSTARGNPAVIVRKR